MTLAENPTHIDPGTRRILSVLSARRKRWIATELLGYEPEGDLNETLLGIDHGVLIPELRLAELKELCLQLNEDGSGLNEVELQRRLKLALEFQASDDDLRERHRRTYERRESRSHAFARRIFEVRSLTVLFAAGLVFAVKFVGSYDLVHALTMASYGATTTVVITTVGLGRTRSTLLFGLGLMIVDLFLFDSLRPFEWLFFSCVGYLLAMDAEDLEQRAGVRLPSFKRVLAHDPGTTRAEEAPTVTRDDDVPPLPPEVVREFADKEARRRQTQQEAEQRQKRRFLGWVLGGACLATIYMSFMTSSVIIKFLAGFAGGATTGTIFSRNIPYPLGCLMYGCGHVLVCCLALFFGTLPEERQVVLWMITSTMLAAATGGLLGIAAEQWDDA